MEIDGLVFEGNGQITDTQTGVQAVIHLSAGIELAQIVLGLDQETKSDGFIYPRIVVADVVFQLQSTDLIDVKVQGDLPLYKSREFEKGVKKWMTSQMAHREAEFKSAL